MNRLTTTTLLAVVAAGLTGCGGQQDAAGKAAPEAAPAVPVPVSVAVAHVEPSVLVEPVVGTVRPKLQATVSPKISGRILELAVVPGQRVEAGQLVARLEAGELEASRNRALAALEQANRELERQRQLLQSRATAQALVDQADAAQRMAAASLKEIESTLAQATVRAPFSGTVTRKLADTGDLGLPGRGLVLIEDPGHLRFEAPVPESLAGSLAVGQKIPVLVDAIAARLEGTVAELEPSADSASRTFVVRLDLPDTKGLRAGLFGRAHLPRGEAPRLLVPAAAVVRRGQMELVFGLSDGRATLHLVRTVPAADGRRILLSGLADAQQVVVDPPATLREGDAVVVK